MFILLTIVGGRSLPLVAQTLPAVREHVVLQAGEQVGWAHVRRTHPRLVGQSYPRSVLQQIQHTLPGYVLLADGQVQCCVSQSVLRTNTTLFLPGKRKSVLY